MEFSELLCNLASVESSICDSVHIGGENTIGWSGQMLLFQQLDCISVQCNREFTAVAAAVYIEWWEVPWGATIGQ